MSFLDDDKSIEDSRPRDLYQFVMPTGSIYLTSAVTDQVWQGIVWKSGAIQRTTLGVSTITGRKELTVSMDVSHAIPQRWLVQGGPPKQIQVILIRLQTNGDHRREWGGNVMSMSLDGRIATFVIPAASNIHLQRRLPTLLIGKICPHFLYDTACRVNKSLFTVSRSVVGLNGIYMTLNSAPDVDDWALFGILEHVATGQTMTITRQVGASIIIEAPIYELKPGDSVNISAGCPHDIVACDIKFNNKVNFGGFAQLPTKNIFIPNGLGVLEQE